MKGQLSAKDQIMPTDMGVPQGGPISPTISNMVLNGIENAVSRCVRTTEVTSSFQTVSPKTKILWTKDKIPFFCKFGMTSYTELVSEVELCGLIPPNTLTHRSILSYAFLGKLGASCHMIEVEDPKTICRDTINDSWSATFRFAHDCLMLFNSQRAIDAAIKGIELFLEPRGLALNKEKTKVRNLDKEDFTFVGYGFSPERRRGRDLLISFPPREKIDNLKAKVNSLFQFRKPKPYNAFLKVNSIVRGCINFYSVSNA